MRSIHGPQQPELPGSIGNPKVGERELRELPQQDDEPQQRDEPFEASAMCEQVLLQLDDVPVHSVDSQHFGARRGQPSACGGAWDASSCGLMDVTRRTDEIAEAMVICALSSSCGAHASIMITIGHRTIPTVNGLDSGSQAAGNGENSRKKLQNVVANSRARRPAFSPPHWEQRWTLCRKAAAD